MRFESGLAVDHHRPSPAGEDFATGNPTSLRKPAISVSRRGPTQSENFSSRVWTTNSVHITRLQNCNPLPHTHPKVLNKKVSLISKWMEIPMLAKISKSRESSQKSMESSQGAAYLRAR